MYLELEDVAEDEDGVLDWFRARTMYLRMTLTNARLVHLARPR